MSQAKDQIKYRVFSMGGHPVFAAADHSKSARLAGIARYQPITFKRSLYRKIMTAAICTGLDRFIASTVQNPIVNNTNFDFASWLKSLASIMGEDDISAAIFWPPQADRGRVYVHILNSKQKPLGFAKISFDDHNDKCLDNEAKLLKQLSSTTIANMRVPEVINYQPAATGSHSVLLLEPLPADARPLEPNQASFPADCAKAIAGAHYPLESGGCETLSWWPAFLNRSDAIDDAFSKELSDSNTEKAMLCRSHGDFTIANLVKDSNEILWVFDWEESCPDGPILADEVSFFLDIHRPKTDSDHQTLITQFKTHFLAESDPIRRIDVMLALAFRFTVHKTDADLIISRWSHL